MTDPRFSERMAITDLMARYTINGDRGQLAGLAACFAPDGILEFPGTSAKSPAEIISVLSNGPRNPSLTFVRHHLTSSLIEFEATGKATGRTYFQVCSNAGLDHIGVYADRFVHLVDGWRIAHRQVRIDWQSPDSLFRRFETRH
ncbi:MAG: nuclear transport factor 2 family protein [Alphaproteobacteria bacterium HGW-Alphaproteobacteria-18]|nr:MAG: nuclear transport factor 2 family protein [Alphaproteobacteria bacterium HGW-Alphaproteobacteria-18]